MTNVAKKVTTKKTTANSATAVAEDEQKRPTKLTPMELAAMAYYVSVSYKDTAQHELEVQVDWPDETIQALLSYGLLEVKDGVFAPSGLAIKWVLNSTTFGINFAKFFSPKVTQNTSVLHAALIAVVDELYMRHVKEGKLIFFFDQKGQPSKFWRQILQKVNKLEYCLEAAPDDFDLSSVGIGDE